MTRSCPGALGAALLLGLLTGCDAASSGGSSAAPPSTAQPAANTATPAGAPDTPRPAPPPAGPATPAAPAPARGAASIETGPGQGATQPVLTQPPLAFDPSPLDFGFIPPNVNRRDTIKITNVGSAPVRLLQAVPTCSCTTLTPVNGRVLQPGGSTEMEVLLEGRAMAGPRKASIKIVAEGFGEAAEVDIAAEVSQAVRATPAILNLATADWFGHVVVESIDGSSFSILSTNGTPPVYVDFDPEIDQPTTRYVIEWDLRGYQDDVNKLPHWYVIETDHPDAPIVDAWVRHPVTIDANRVRKWRVFERRILLPPCRAGEPVRVTVEVRDLGNEVIHTVRPLSKLFDIALLENVKREGTTYVTVEIRPKPGTTGVMHGAAEFISGVQSQRVDVIGKVSG